MHNVRNDVCPEDSFCGLGPGVQGPALENFDWQPIADGPLVDAGSSGLSPGEDFRSFLRPAGNGPDIGAVESGAEPPDIIFRDAFEVP